LIVTHPGNRSDKTYLSIAVSTRLKDRFRRAAKRNMTNMNEQIRFFMARYIEENLTTKNRKKVIDG